ncbi:MAG: helix-turn-helix transcriptional regulator [Cyclobacteriaceae bacterium]|nr:helix-turn-helix transcriptional regulator [Cyclobacteriaceae bacterium]UYN87119.1 MAG: helix-turn-helix transcriptional regulator [Cyclobacteriaceae bacterium]
MFTRSKRFISMIDNEVVSRIAQKIRATRLEKNLTIQQLANRTKVSKGLLSKIENSRTLPSLPVFITLIQSLDISLKEFFSEMVLLNGKDYLVVKKVNTKRWSAKDAKGSITSIFFHRIFQPAPWRPYCLP